MKIKHYYDNNTATFTYIVADTKTYKCAIIDSVLDYDQVSGRTSNKSINQVLEYIKKEKLDVEWILETHVHADHLTGSQELKKHFPEAKTAIGENIKDVIKHWTPIFNTLKDTAQDGSQFDHLFKDNEIFHIGSLEVKTMYTPGHTPACLCYIVEDSIFVGDTIFMPYVGTARADFPGGSAKDLYRSVQKILALPDSTKIYTCHDYPLEGEQPKCVSTVAEQKEKNSMIHKGVSEEDYVTARNNKDFGKPLPKLIAPSVQVNIRAGSLGYPENNGVQYVKVPINKL